MAEKFDHLEEHLEKFVENIRQLGIIVSDFQPSSQAGLSQKLNFIVTGLQDIDKCRQQLHDITVPLEVFEYIDQGRNPQLYTKECLERALAKNEQVKGKIDTMKCFQKTWPSIGASGGKITLRPKWGSILRPCDNKTDPVGSRACHCCLPATGTGLAPTSCFHHLTCCPCSSQSLGDPFFLQGNRQEDSCAEM
ncbi:mediator of RNA polymerase II transcription subunit 10 isoform X1 [Mus pahari]|uniref:mediator of RNA polymerase II transcription subunit 10 isoform X1 n=1 Tax=Mus pahari TaxID=10093 RepID=UPI001114C8E5|nr:mediator of RNA polymerase II transcription subunit 10 isoform X1 [Mus pahari]